MNVAARMESHGVAGRVQVSESTHRLLAGAYGFDSRGLIEMKGKGQMRAYLLKRALLAA